MHCLLVPWTALPLLTLLPGCVHPRQDAAAVIHRDIAYGRASDAQRLDLYLPPPGPVPHPLIISIHGGAFRFGDKADHQVDPMLEGLGRGFAVASINYRLSGEALFPAQIQDVKAAILHLRRHAADYGLDPGRFAVWGGSAGGHLACLAGTSAGVAALSPEPGADDRVQAVVAWFPPLDFTAMDDQLRASGSGPADHDAADSPESRLLGAPLPTVPERARLAAPATWLDAGDPPMLLQHGTADALVPVAQTTAFAARAATVPGGPTVQVDLLPGAGHGDPAFRTPANVARVLDFLKTNLAR